jgi:cytochrome oxidase assembly protein ShyY1
LREPLHFDAEWRITLFTLLFVPLMTGLGFWQLQRAEEKAALGANWEQRKQESPAPLANLRGQEPSQLAYRRAHIDGHFVPQHYFLLDNRVRQGRFGYEILAVMRSEDGNDSVLINRGWVAGDPARRSLPEVREVTGNVSVTGHVYVAPGEPYLLGEQPLPAGWPKVIQAVEMDKLATAVGGSVFPYPVRLDSGQPGALETGWQVVNVSPAKHQGYAVQWFTMALVLLVFYLLRSSNLWQWLTGRTRTES